MITLTTLIKNTVEGNFTRIAGDYKVVGQATWTNNKMHNCAASIVSNETGQPVANFSVAGMGNSMRVNQSDVDLELKAVIDVIVNETIAELTAIAPSAADFTPASEQV